MFKIDTVLRLNEFCSFDTLLALLIYNPNDKILFLFRHKNEEILILVGGWTGKKRSNTVYAFDLKDKKWIGLKAYMSRIKNLGGG